MPPLVKAEQAIVAGDGTATVSIGPVPPWQTWRLNRLAVRATAGRPEARVYRGDFADSTFVDGTYDGGSDVSEYPAGLVLLQGEYLTVRWTAGTPGATVTARAEGDIT